MQPVASGGKSSDRGSGRNKPNPLPPAATGCGAKCMVRRGSTVRVRQRALQKACTAAAYRAEPLAPRSTCGGYGALYGAFRSKTSSAARAESPLSQLSKAAEKSLISWSPSVPRSACGSSAPILRSVHTSSASEASSRKTAVSVACDVNAGRYGTGRIAGLPGVVACNRS